MGLIDRLGEFCSAGLASLYPHVCQICGATPAAPQDSLLCERCRGTVRYIEPPFCSRCGLPFQGAITSDFECGNCRDTAWHFTMARSAAAARDVVLETIHRYKYQRALWFEPFLAGLLIDRAGPQLRVGDWDCLVPVPLYPTKEREREFNQAERLARRLSSETGLPVKTGVLRRVAPTKTQTRLTREERRDNVRKAFAAVSGVRLHGERVVLIDDVFTTGATTNACAAVLKQAGASQVCVWTVARGI